MTKVFVAVPKANGKTKQRKIPPPIRIRKLKK